MHEFSPRVRPHVTSLFSSKKWSRRKVEFCPSGGQSLHLICASALALQLCMHVCNYTSSSLGVSLMALRYICLFSARPRINDPAKQSSHRSPAVLIYHYSALISWISTSLPMRGAGGEMSRDKHPNSQIQSGEGVKETCRREEWGSCEKTER